MAELTPLVVDDFSGGVTDFFVGGATTKAEVFDNFVVNENRDAFTRPGSRAKFPFRITTDPITNIVNNQSNILMRAGSKVFYADTSSHEIVSSQGHSVFTSGSLTNRASFAYWNKHTVAAGDQFAPVQKIYRDQTMAWRTSNLGLPEIIFPVAMGLANQLKAKFNAHIASHTIHSVSSDTTNTIVSPNASDFASLMTLVAELLVKYQTHQDDSRRVSGRLYHGGLESADHSMSTTSAPQTLYAANEALKEIMQKYNLHDADSTAHAVASSQQAAYALPSVTGTTGTNSYIYAAHFTYRYTAEDTDFVERGTVELIEVTSMADPASNAITVSNLPVLSSGALNSWDDANVTISLYRTTNAGGVLFFLGEIKNGVISYVDSLSDTDLQNRQVAYTEGGVIDNDMPPPSKFAEIIGDTLMLAHVKEGSVVRKNRTRYSKPGSIYACPESFYDDFPDEITATGAIGTYPIVFLAQSIYRLEGGFDSSGAGGYTKRLVSNRIGCTSPQSVVRASNGSGLYFAGEDGWYFTDGFSYKRITSELKVTYPKLQNRHLMSAAFDGLNNRVLWAVQSQTGLTSSDKVYVSHLDYGASFTTWSGGLDQKNFTISALGYIDGVLYRADERGYLLYHDVSYQDDAAVDTTKLPSLWGTQTIHYNYTSPAFDFGSKDLRKWVSKVVINADNASSMSLQISSSNDRSDVYADLKPILRKGSIEWGDPTVIWGVTDVAWNYFPVISEWRHMPRTEQALRCSYKQLKLSNAYTEIDNSGYAGPCSIDSNGVTATVALLSAPLNTWLTDAVNYYISFSTDGYVREYLITGRTSSTLTVKDDSASLSDLASTAWKIRGYRKREVLNLMNLSLLYQVISRTQVTYHKGAQS